MVRRPVTDARQSPKRVRACPETMRIRLSGAPFVNGQNGRKPNGSANGVGPVSIIAPDLHISGIIESPGEIQVFGSVEGEISGQHLTIGETASIRGSIVAQSVWIGGFIDGPVTAMSVTMAETARVVGSIFHNQLTVDPGAVHEGRKPWRLNPLERLLTNEPAEGQA